MAANVDYDSDGTPINREANPDSILMPRMYLPNDRIVKYYSLGWENTIAEEIELLLIKKYFEGKVEDYDMQLSINDRLEVLQKDNVVEFYRKPLLQNTKIFVVYSSTVSKELPDLGVNARDQAAVEVKKTSAK